MSRLFARTQRSLAPHHLACAALCIVFGMISPGCSSTSGPHTSPDPDPPLKDEAARPRPVTTRVFGDVRTIRTFRWSEPWRVYLLGVDARAGRAFVRLEQRAAAATDDAPARVARFAIDTIDLRTGKRLERWEATPANAPKLVGGYPRFHPLRGTPGADLAKYAALLRRAGPWSTREAPTPLGVRPAPHSAQVLHTRRPDRGDGDWLMRSSGKPGERPRRIDRGARASYNMTYSPDGGTIAWFGGRADQARFGRQIGYVLHIKRGDAAPKLVPQVRDVLRSPIWTADGRHLFALGLERPGRRCLHRVDARTLTTRRLRCHDGLMDVVVRPDGARALVIEHPRNPSRTTREVILLDTVKNAEIARFGLETPQGMGPFALFLDATRAIAFTHGGQGLRLLDTRAGKAGAARTYKGEALFFAGHRTTRPFDGELILLRRDARGVALVGVQLPGRR